jgi:hypothetical protein
VRPDPTRVARTLVAWSMTWLLVSTRPEEDTIIPVPSAVSPRYLSVEVMSTRPGLTFLSTLSTAAGLSAADDPLPDALLCGVGTSLEVPADDPPPWLSSAIVTPAPMLAASAATAM